MKPGYKQTEVGLIPDDWLFRSVGQLIDEGTIEKPLDGNHGNIHPKSGDFVEYGIPFVMANNVRGGEVDLVNCAFIRKEQADSLQKGFSRTGDVLITHKATIGNTAIVGKIPFDYIMLTPQVTYYRVAEKDRLSNFYLRQFFDSAGFQSVLRALAGGGTRSYIGIKAQRQLPIVLPPTITEQHAIAEALSDVDALLRTLDRLIAKKRDLKQAAMQQLLTGQTRLPGFSGEREVKLLGEVATIKDGTHQTPKYVDSGIPFYSVEHVTSGDFKNTKYISVAEHRFLTRTFKIEKGDILMTRIGSIGDCKLIDWNVEASFYVSLALLKINSGFSAAYIEHYSKSTAFQKEMELHSLQSAIPKKINLGPISEVKIELPPLPEQAAIARILSEMDAELSGLEQRREKTRALKQGMMQELLTGRTRLTSPELADA